MLRHLTALSVLALSLLAGGSARAEYYMVSAYEFRSMNEPSKQFLLSGGRGGYINSSTGSVTATLRIPTGKVLNTIYCQLLDASSTRDITITVGEVQSRDDGGFGTTTMLSMSTSGAPGHTKISSSSWTGPRVIKTWDGQGPYTYYGYTITASLGDTSNLNIKSCAIDFF